MIFNREFRKQILKFFSTQISKFIVDQDFYQLNSNVLAFLCQCVTCNSNLIWFYFSLLNLIQLTVAKDKFQSVRILNN